VDSKIIIGLATALGIGLLMGAERERSNGDAAVGAAGVRTFALTALLGGVAALFGSPAIVVAFGLLIGAHSALSYVRSTSRDPGLTTEVALLLAYLLGVYSSRNPALAAGLAVVATILLAARGWLHRMVRQRLSEQELHDALLLGACALVILPLLPQQPVDPWNMLNLRTIWKFAILLMAINGVGHIAVRALGARRGLPLAGLTAGFVSSSATHAAMGSRARANTELMRPAVAATALSSVATVIQLALLVAVVDATLLLRLLPSLLASGAVAVLYAALFLWHALRTASRVELPQGRAFSPRVALGFALLMTGVIGVTTLARHYFGTQGAFVSIGLSGFADAHAAAASAASLHAAGGLDHQQAIRAILLAFTTNAITKAVLAYWNGGAAFGNRLLPGLLLMVGAAWAATLLA